MCLSHPRLMTGYSACILDAAVLLQAKWDTGLNEVWVAIIPVEEVSLTQFNMLYLMIQGCETC